MTCIVNKTFFQPLDILLHSPRHSGPSTTEWVAFWTMTHTKYMDRITSIESETKLLILTVSSYLKPSVGKLRNRALPHLYLRIQMHILNWPADQCIYFPNESPKYITYLDCGNTSYLTKLVWSKSGIQHHWLGPSTTLSFQLKTFWQWNFIQRGENHTFGKERPGCWRMW